MANNSNGTGDERFLDSWRRWRRAREVSVTAPYGPLSPIAMDWLDEHPRRIAAAPGRWSHSADGIHLELARDDNPRYDCSALNPNHRAGTLTLPAPDTAGYVIENGETRIEVVRRGDRVLVRPRHPGNAAAMGYRGTPTFAPDPAWVVAANFHRYDEPTAVAVGAVAPGLTHTFSALGELVFTREGRNHRLQAFATGEDAEVQVIFTDATSGESTWRDNRRVTATLDASADRATRATIDFNRATNFPGAYTEHATCPLPPAGNHLDLAVTAGEQTPVHRRH